MTDQKLESVVISLMALTLLLGDPTLMSAQERDDTGLNLFRAVAMAQERYPSLAVARARERAAEDAVGRATAERWPRLGARASWTRFEEPMLVAPLHSFQLTTVPEFDKTLVRGDVSLRYTLFDGGARSGRIAEARSEAAATAAGVASSRMALTAAVVRAYLEVLSAKDVDAAQANQIAALERERGRVASFLEEGRAAQVELLRVEAALADAEARRVTTRARLGLAHRELARLLGVEAERIDPAALVGVALTPASEIDGLSALIDGARMSNPDLERARQAVDAAEASGKVVRAARWPHLDLMGAYQAFSDPDFDGALEWQAGLILTYPIFTGGERASAISAAAARTRAARQELRLAELRIEGDLDRALSAVLETAARVEAMERALQHQSEVARIELLALEAGAGTQTDYLRAEAELLRVRSALVEARNAEIVTRTELARVTGQLGRDWLIDNLEITP